MAAVKKFKFCNAFEMARWPSFASWNFICHGFILPNLIYQDTLTDIFFGWLQKTPLLRDSSLYTIAMLPHRWRRLTTMFTGDPTTIQFIQIVFSFTADGIQHLQHSPQASARLDSMYSPSMVMCWCNLAVRCLLLSWFCYVSHEAQLPHRLVWHLW